MITILGKPIESNGSKYKAHTVLGSCNEKTTALEEDLVKGEHVWEPSEKQVNLEGDGSFSLRIPNKNKINGSLLLQVVAPDGDILASKEYSREDLRERITINVDAMVFPNIIGSDDPFLGKPVKITGRIIDAENKQQISNKQVTLWAIPELESTTEEDSSDNRFEVVLVTRTDKQGCFSEEYPKGKYKKACGVTDVGKNERIPIRLEENAKRPNTLSNSSRSHW